MTYTYSIFKIIEHDGVKYYFSQNAYETMLKEISMYSLESDNNTYLMYCNGFEVI